jgi:uncharacterized protein (TIGR02145 family)
MYKSNYQIVLHFEKMKKTQPILISPFLLMGLCFLFLSSCKKDDIKNLGIPELSTIEVTKIAQKTAQSGGIITSDEGFPITARGICWSTSDKPTIDDNKTTDGTGKGSFESDLTDLTIGTTYYVRAYATNSKGTSYGSTTIFQTLGDTFTDARDGNVYKMVTIGNQIWMAENLRYLPSVVGPGTGSQTTPYYYVYGYNGTNVSAAKATDNYATYGVLYNWPAAMAGASGSEDNPSGVQGVSPEGWHLPSHAEWEELENYLADNGYNFDGTIGGGRTKIAKSLASASRWESSTTAGAVGNNDYPGYRNKTGFTALPGGYRYNDGVFYSIGNTSFFWNATSVSSTFAYGRVMGKNITHVNMGGWFKDEAFSIRCVKD